MKVMLGMVGAIVAILLGAAIYLFYGTEVPEAVTVGNCEPENLRIQTTWESADANIVGILEVANASLRPCRIRGFPRIALEREGAALPLSSTTTSKEPEEIILNANDSALAGYVWENWCGGGSGAFMLRVRLPDSRTETAIPVLGPDDQPLGSTPACAARNQDSRISVGPFVREDRPIFD